MVIDTVHLTGIQHDGYIAGAAGSGGGDHGAESTA